MFYSVGETNVEINSYNKRVVYCASLSSNRNLYKMLWGTEKLTLFSNLVFYKPREVLLEK